METITPNSQPTPPRLPGILALCAVLAGLLGAALPWVFRGSIEQELNTVILLGAASIGAATLFSFLALQREGARKARAFLRHANRIYVFALIPAVIALFVGAGLATPVLSVFFFSVPNLFLGLVSFLASRAPGSDADTNEREEASYTFIFAACSVILVVFAGFGSVLLAGLA